MDVHKIISYLPERPYYYEHMTGMELLKFYGSLFGIHDVAFYQRLLEKVSLAGDASKTIAQYSKGMQQRIGLAQSLLNDPKLLFLDEPTGGLDPIAHTEIRDLILQFRDEGRTVFISSHELSEVERICDRVAIINRGVIAKQGKLEDLLRGSRVEIIAENVQRAFADTIKDADTTVSFHEGRFDRRLARASRYKWIDRFDSIIEGNDRQRYPARKRLEDLFVETVRDVNVRQAAESAKPE